VRGRERLRRWVQTNSTVRTLRTVSRQLRRQNITILAGSFAYHALLSLLPLLFLLFVLTGVVLDEPLAVFVVERTERYLTPGESLLVADVVTDEEGRFRASLLSVGLLLWGSLKVFRQLDAAFATVYGTKSGDSLADQVRDGAVVLFAVGSAVLAFYGVAVLFDEVHGVPLLGVAQSVLVVLGATAALFPLYLLFPNVDVTLLEVVPGTVVAGVGWTALQGLFKLYLGVTGQYEAYGVFGGFLLLALWLYLAGLLLMAGAVVNAVVGGHLDGADGGSSRRETPPPE
jgi:membrane protein